jgi:hypothetical protein
MIAHIQEIMNGYKMDARPYKGDPIGDDTNQVVETGCGRRNDARLYLATFSETDVSSGISIKK